MIDRMAGPVSVAEKREAIDRVLNSRALKRSEQLRDFFRYVCEAELEGNGASLNEYVLGVNVLGRPPGYSPAEDSCVRTRAHELRKRLRAYYDAEARDDPIRISIDKGGYCPRFERARASEPPPASAPNGGAPRLTAELNALWAPLLDGNAPLLIAFDVRLFFFAPATGLVVRDYQVNVPADAARSQPLEAFRGRMQATELRETWDYADFGTVHAAFLLGRLLSGTRLDVGMKHSSSLDWHDVWNSNVVFIGKPHINPMVRSLLAGREFWTDELGVVHIARPRPGEAAQYPSAETHGWGEKYAVITRLRGPQPGRFLLLLSSVAAELMWALAEAVTNPGHAAELMSRLQTPAGDCPEQFQIIIRATFQSNVPVEIGYVTHRALPDARPPI
ncbi:MAG TPA: hypothetical protein VNN80_26705 [Polyangiaceae bacterium]|nr:hypothetical protein [Polyangiaceae bacterium]